MHRWSVDATKILTRGEIVTVIGELRRKGRRSVNTRMNLAIFRLATCCGLRASEVTGLTLCDVRLGLAHPYLRIPKAIAKGGRARRVPLWWDAGTLTDLAGWRDERLSHGAQPGDLFVCKQSCAALGRPLNRLDARARFIRLCRVLDPERQRELTIRSGRHPFVSHALAGGRSLTEVRDAAGHGRIAVTSLYMHVVADAGQDPGWIAIDLLSQAEHDPASQSILMTDDEALAAAVIEAVGTHLATLPRADIAARSWADFGAVITLGDLGEAVALIDRLAPEHLELAIEDPDSIADEVRNAGAIFLGRYTPEAIGDYVAGPNHVLPTNRSARYASGLGVGDFLKRTSIVGCDADSLAAIGPAAMTLAKAEGLDAHALSIAIRLNIGRKD